MKLFNLQAITGYFGLYAQSQIFAESIFGIIVLLIMIVILILLLTRYKKRNIEPSKENSSVERYAIFVDSESLFRDITRIKKFLTRQSKNNCFQEKRFDILSFLNDVIGGRICVIKKYYRGEPEIIQGEENPTTVKEKYEKKKFIEFMQNHGYDVPKGGREVCINGHLKEEGIVILLVIDVLMGAVNDLYDTAIIVSSRRGLLPLVEEINKHGKRCIYIGFDHDIVQDLHEIAYRRKIYKSDEMKKFFIDASS